VPRKIRCKIDKIIPHGEGVYTVEFVPERKAPRFKPGQFLHLALDHYDPSSFWPESRVFSIVSSPAQRDRLKISYSVIGRFTTRMEQELVENDRVWVKMPYGNFTITDGKDVVLFAGGTGITAFTSFLESLTGEFQRQVTLFYGARSNDHLIYHDKIEEWVRANSQIQTYYFIENFRNSETASVNVMSGRISVSKAWLKITNPLDSNYFLSGPPAMLKAITIDLQTHQVQKKSIHIDAWE